VNRKVDLLSSPLLPLPLLDRDMDQEDEENTRLGLSLAIDAHKPSTHGKTKSSFPCTTRIPNNLKRGKRIETDEQTEIQKDISIQAGEELEELNFCKKKLRLTTEQHSILESTFREHTTLTPVRLSISCLSL
jgi:hypothetical protein